MPRQLRKRDRGGASKPPYSHPKPSSKGHKSHSKSRSRQKRAKTSNTPKGHSTFLAGWDARKAFGGKDVAAMTALAAALGVSPPADLSDYEPGPHVEHLQHPNAGYNVPGHGVVRFSCRARHGPSDKSQPERACGHQIATHVGPDVCLCQGHYESFCGDMGISPIFCPNMAIALKGERSLTPAIVARLAVENPALLVERIEKLGLRFGKDFDDTCMSGSLRKAWNELEAQREIDFDERQDSSADESNSDSSSEDSSSEDSGGEDSTQETDGGSNSDSD